MRLKTVVDDDDVDDDEDADDDEDDDVEGVEDDETGESLSVTPSAVARTSSIAFPAKETATDCCWNLYDVRMA